MRTCLQWRCIFSREVVSVSRSSPRALEAAPTAKHTSDGFATQETPLNWSLEAAILGTGGSRVSLGELCLSSRDAIPRCLPLPPHDMCHSRWSRINNSGLPARELSGAHLPARPTHFTNLSRERIFRTLRPDSEGRLTT